MDGLIFGILRYLVRLKILEWIKLLRGHLHQMHETEPEEIS